MRIDTGKWAPIDRISVDLSLFNLLELQVVGDMDDPPGNNAPIGFFNFGYIIGSINLRVGHGLAKWNAGREYRSARSALPVSYIIIGYMLPGVIIKMSRVFMASFISRNSPLPLLEPHKRDFFS